MIGYYTYLPSKIIMVKFFKTMKYTQCLSFDVTVPSFCTGQALLTNAIGLRMVLSGTVSFRHVVPSPVCNKTVPGSILDASLSRYKGLFHTYIVFYQ